MKLRSICIILSFIVGSALSLYGQTAEHRPDIKSVTVLEEKYNTLVRKQYKESETFYDSRGNIIEEISYKQGEINKHFKYIYNSENQKIREEEYESSGALKEASEYVYKEGLRSEKIVYDGSKKIKSRKIYQYSTF